MSIKRSKQVYRGKGTRREEREEDKKQSKDRAPKLDWTQEVQNQPEEVFVPYAQTGTFEKGSFIRHQVFGKGLVTAVEGGRIEVLFETGLKRLVHTGPPSRLPSDGK